MKKYKEDYNQTGFTLLELLAVIVVLAIIALIVTPFVTNAIKEARAGAVKNSLYGISEAAELYYAKNLEEGITSNAVINLKDGTIAYKGKIDNGSLLFNDNGDTKIIISSGKYCAYKNYSSNVLTGVVEGDYCNINNNLINISTLEIGESELKLMVHAETEIPTQSGIDNEIVLISDIKVTNYLISNTEPSIKNKGTVWIVNDTTSLIHISMENTYIPISKLYQYDGSKWNSKEASIYNNSSWNKFSTEEYSEAILNGTDPVYSNKLIPVVIENDGTVLKADTTTKWYNYNEKRWANAVVLTDDTEYSIGATIPESNIESYFVWIPRYRYKLWNTGTAIKTAHSIDIIFENKDTSVSNGSNNGEWLTHPAFTSFNTNGIWVGKFETGYKGATSTEAAQVTSDDSTKIIVKPNAYSWRNNTVYNFFTSAYGYLRENDSHMMKNTEWGAVTYLSHSIYGIDREININNNLSYKTGYSALQVESNPYPEVNGDGFNSAYNTKIGYLASTTGNITGIYDMSGGAQEYMASYMSGQLGSSGFNATNIATYNSKYFDIYNASSNIESYQYRILGDATGEMGPFNGFAGGDSDRYISYHNSWYTDGSDFIVSTNPWFIRGGDHGYYVFGALAVQFNFTGYTGAVDTELGSRLVLAH